MSNIQWVGAPVRPAVVTHAMPSPQHPIMRRAERLVALAGGPRITREYQSLGDAAEGNASSTYVVWTFLSIAGAALAAYHGYKRSHESVGSAVGWGVLGGLFPIITVPVALAQGYGKPKGSSDNPSRVVRRGAEFAEVGVFEHEGMKFEAGGAFYDREQGLLVGYPVSANAPSYLSARYTLTRFDGEAITPLRLVSKYRGGFGREQMWSWSATYDGRVFHGRNLGPNMLLRMRAGRSAR